MTNFPIDHCAARDARGNNEAEEAEEIAVTFQMLAAVEGIHVGEKDLISESHDAYAQIFANMLLASSRRLPALGSGSV
jgi:hypothetical protein